MTTATSKPQPSSVDIISPTGRPSQRGQWTWELVTQFPRQGHWTEEQYLRREFEGMVEFTDGVLDFIHPLYPPEEGGPPASERGDWTWEMLTEFPRQGEWTEERYLDLPKEIHAELNDGCLEFRSMPNWIHSWLVDYLHDHLKAFVRSRRLGLTGSTPIRVRTIPNKVREPDIAYLQAFRLPDPREPSNGADLVMEIVSEGYGDRERDLVEKRREYAQANIPEYWIVDPETETIIVLTLPAGGTEYAVHGEFKPGQTATSKLLDGFTVDVTACFAAGKGV
jgi:Uma2 family endonuclease